MVPSKYWDRQLDGPSLEVLSVLARIAAVALEIMQYIERSLDAHGSEVPVIHQAKRALHATYKLAAWKHCQNIM